MSLAVLPRSSARRRGRVGCGLVRHGYGDVMSTPPTRITSAKQVSAVALLDDLHKDIAGKTALAVSASQHLGHPAIKIVVPSGHKGDLVIRFWCDQNGDIGVMAPGVNQQVPLRFDPLMQQHVPDSFDALWSNFEALASPHMEVPKPPRIVDTVFGMSGSRRVPRRRVRCLTGPAQWRAAAGSTDRGGGKVCVSKETPPFQGNASFQGTAHARSWGRLVRKTSWGRALTALWP